MSMNGEYVRLTPDELERVIGDHEWATALVEKLMDADARRRPGSAEARCHGTDKAWDAIGFLTRRAGFLVDIVHGEEQVPWGEDWGYGPPRYLSPDRVRTAAEAMAETGADRLVEGVGPADLTAAEVYPVGIWERDDSLEYATGHYEALVPFFRSAAEAGDAILVWLS
ncbi:YfbM family protein [Streptomyces sp. AM 4-1-1]|uniref:YfbM family protein n=1 Tax=Streptomyces sp. AM 4-1-1 TaxID=3028710 RepID=UPI0023B97E38|nr:YfbM family protein [Streptomyces sp. AM 4-1-1]WEH34760.1 YfbM family protein [Streptomyces sp. AM 4-1-1]